MPVYKKFRKRNGQTFTKRFRSAYTAKKAVTAWQRRGGKMSTSYRKTRRYY